MFLGKVLKFKCDGCGKCFEKSGFGLPDGMKYANSNFLTDEPVTHYCAECEANGKHGKKKLYAAGAKPGKN